MRDSLITSTYAARKHRRENKWCGEKKDNDEKPLQLV